MAADAIAAAPETVLIYRAQTRKFHRPGDHPYRPACATSRSDGQQVDRDDAEALGFVPCQSTACFGGEVDE